MPSLLKARKKLEFFNPELYKVWAWSSGKDLLEIEVVLERSYDGDNMEKEVIENMGVSSLPKTLLLIAGRLLNQARMTYSNGNCELRWSILSHHLSIMTSKPSLERDKDGHKKAEAKEGEGEEI